MEMEIERVRTGGFGALCFCWVLCCFVFMVLSILFFYVILWRMLTS